MNCLEREVLRKKLIKNGFDIPPCLVSSCGRKTGPVEF